MNIRKLTIIVSILLSLVLLNAGAKAQVESTIPDSLQGVNFWNEDGKFVGQLATAACPPLVAFKVIPATGLVDTTENYQIKMTLQQGGIPRSGGVAFNFPPNFDLKQIKKIDYSDEYSGSDLIIRKFFVFNSTVIVSFKSGQSPPAGTIITFTVHSIKNPIIAGDYQISGLIFSPWFRVVAGPTLSEPFTIFPGSPVAMTISPSAPITLRAGNYQLFTTVAYDRFQNEIRNLEISWQFTSGSDSIGILTGGNLFATTVGTAKVVAAYNQLLATSGLITVLPGETDHFAITSYPMAVINGEPFPSGVETKVYDKFGNLKTDYNGTAHFISSDPKADLFYNETNQYQFTAADSGRHLFEGTLFTLVTAGAQTISITDGVHYGQSGIITVTGGTSAIVTFKMSIEPPDEIRAGSPVAVRIFDAFDKNGNPVGGTIIISLLGDGTSPGGFAPIINDVVVVDGTGSSDQYIFRAGEAALRAAINTVSREASVNIIPGELGNLKVSIQPTQFVGNPLIGPATLTVFDKYGNLKTDFNAAMTPVEISVDKGSLNKAELAAAGDFAGGVADLAAKGILFDGEAGAVIMAYSAESIETHAMLQYNGIDFKINDPVPDSIMIGQRYSLRTDVMNKGFLTPLAPVVLTDYFVSCPVECFNKIGLREIAPGSTLRTLASLNTDNLTPHISDTIIVQLTSKYLFESDTITVVRSQSFPVTIIAPLSLTYIPGSLSIDTLLSPSLLPHGSFQLQLDQDIDSSELSFGSFLSIKCGDKDVSVYADAFEGKIDGQTITIEFTGLHLPDLRQNGDCPEGFKNISAGIYLYYSGQLFFRTSLYNFDSVFVVYPASLSYHPGTLSPSIVAAGGETSFEFEIDLAGKTSLALDSVNSRFELAYSGGILTGKLNSSSLALKPGESHLTTKAISIPTSLLNAELTPRLFLKGMELYMTRSDTVSFGSERISVSNLPQIKIVSTDLVTVNPPYVNYGQTFAIKVRVQNLSGQVVSNVNAVITSENGHDTLATGVINTIAAYNYKDISLPLTADSVSIPIKIFKSMISSAGAVILPPDDNFTAVTVQSPAYIDLTATISGAYGTIHYLDYAQAFTISVQMNNTGQAEALRGQVMLLTGSYDFGVPDSSVMTLAVDSTGQWSLVSPSITTLVSLVVKLTGIPIDKNTGLPAQVKTTKVAIPVVIEPSAAELLVSGAGSPAPLIVEGTTRELLTLTLKNNTENRLNIIALKTIDVRFFDRRGNPISPETVITGDSSGFFDGDSKLTTAYTTDNILRLSFMNFTFQPKDEKTISFHARFGDVITQSGFNLEIANNDVRAIFVSGPRINQPVPVRGRFDSNFRVGANFVITPLSTEQSLMIRNNPFNPNLEQAEIAYNLETDAKVEFDIYALAGEKVFSTLFPAGSSGGQQGPNYINWDGRNDDGKMVMNGVYVMVIRNTSSGQSYKLKLAVLK